jgi:predicted NAD-dependent protein-ADP-ribosyltransferase YbiA (DUF1768 family)
MSSLTRSDKLVSSLYMLIGLILFSFLNLSQTGSLTNPPPHDPPYPAIWWAPVSKIGAPGWEIFPQDALYGEVILSKRNELGILSNFAATPITYHQKKYASLEGFWQATKFPEDAKDPRATFPGLVWPYTRAQVEVMTAFDAKNAGNIGNQNMTTMGIDWVTFENKRMVYKEPGESDFYKLILEVMKAKLEQNKEVKRILILTGDLKLRPDHTSEAPDLKAWAYYDIWMSLR